MLPFSARLQRADDPDALAARWQRLQSCAEPGFFLSWDWIGCWLAGLEIPPWLLAVVGQDGSDVALGLFCETVETRRKFLRIRQLRLHETGCTDADAITIEYNGLLCLPGLEAAAWTAAWGALCAADAPRWDEVILGGATAETGAFLAVPGLTTMRRAETGSARVDLMALAERGVADCEGYLGTLGKSTRSQIRRSLRLYAESGAVMLDIAGDTAEALAMFDELGVHHEAKWQALGRSSGFSNPAYLAFHRRLLARSFEGGALELLRARAGGRSLGWLYNFRMQGENLFYLSGFVAEEDKRLKPGLVTHALAIERALQRGDRIYDFMGGDDRYKRNLGESGPEIVSFAVQRRRPALLLENAARRIKEQVRRTQRRS